MERKEITKYGVVNSHQFEDLKKLDTQTSSQNWEKPHPVNMNHIIWNIIAKRRMGKSTLVLNTLLDKAYDKHFTSIYLFSPTSENDPKYSKLVKLLKERDTFFAKFDNETISTLIDRLQNELTTYDKMKKTNPKTIEPRNLIIFDDCLAMFGTRAGGGSNPIDQLYYNSAHLKLSIWTTSQTFKGLLPSARKSVDMMSIFMVPNQDELDSLIREISVPKETFMKAYAQVVQRDNSKETNPVLRPFLHVHWLKEGEPTLFDCYNRLDIPFSELVLLNYKFPNSDEPVIKKSKLDNNNNYKTIYDNVKGTL